MSTTSNMEEVSTARHLLRHTVATIAYRGGKALRNAPESFADFRAAESTRTPGQILAHIGDLLEWSVRLVAGEESWRAAWRPLPPQSWSDDMNRFYAALSALDASIANGSPPGNVRRHFVSGADLGYLYAHRPACDA